MILVITDSQGIEARRDWSMGGRRLSAAIRQLKAYAKLRDYVGELPLLFLDGLVSPLSTPLICLHLCQIDRAPFLNPPSLVHFSFIP